MCRVENVGSLAGNIATCSDKSIVIDLHRPTTLHPYKTGDPWTWLASTPGASKGRKFELTKIYGTFISY